MINHPLAIFITLYLSTHPLLLLTTASPTPSPNPVPDPGLLTNLLDPILAPVVKLTAHLPPLNSPPPDILYTPNPSPQCAAVNGGELTCCQAAIAGDLPLVVYLAETYGFVLNPDDVSGIYCKSVSTALL